MWNRTKQQSRAGLDKAWSWADKQLGDPVNKLSNKLGSEAFWPMSLDKESDKAARILSNFCKDGIEKSPTSSSTSTTSSWNSEKSSSSISSTSSSSSYKKPFGPNKIPASVIRDAVGLAIFTTVRTGLVHFSGASGSGVLIARRADGSWSPPSGILLHTAGVGFLLGVDIYDCVLVINTYEALDALCKLRCTVGGELSAAAGPVGGGGSLVDSDVAHKRYAPVWTYVKSRGFYAGVQMDGTVVVARADENERFYGERVPVARILRGEVANVPEGKVDALWEAVRAAEGADGGVDTRFMMTPDGKPVEGWTPPVRGHRPMPSIN
ncbi:hypothetical protein SLS58_008717 [Diplodia intermedia]|uniref:Ysc84 actin-binding domain-containing protein n=1 Tax=Diplodia intermedia TaxID=856260 RepID=A0ABR3TGQ1_9PEZI